MSIVLAWAAAVVTYPVVAWFTRLLLTVITLPLAGRVRSTGSPAGLRVTRLVAGAACGAGGFLAAAWILVRLGQDAPLVLGVVLLVFVALTHGAGLRRLAGGPQLLEEMFSLIGEAAGLLVAVAWHAAA